MSATLDRTGQAMDALARANRNRHLAKDWKDEIGALTPQEARQRAAAVLLEEPGSVGGLTIHAFLTAIPRLGDAKAQRMLSYRAEGWYIWPFRRVRDLTDRQRARLAELLIGGRL